MRIAQRLTYAARRMQDISCEHNIKGTYSDILLFKRVFNIDIEICEHCGGHVKVIACIEDPKVIEQILKHLKQKAAKIDTTNQHKLPPERAPPLTPSLFDRSQSRLFD